MSDWDDIRAEGERISREEGYRVLLAEIAALHAEIARLRLTDEEREAVESTIVDLDGGANFNEQRFWPMLATRLRERSATLRGLLARLGPKGSE